MILHISGVQVGQLEQQEFCHLVMSTLMQCNSWKSGECRHNYPAFGVGIKGAPRQRVLSRAT